MRERLTRRKPIIVEFVREPLQKFASVADAQVNKYRGRISLDCSNLLFPKVTSMKGKLPRVTYHFP